ncbi:bifunctional [glutamate--ammonia ligase]-adenylyl-L-tyrosine phosphorylase/[glutamate--ammonia-ligase] adenylyltransferase [Imbroritus primus]|uniref:Bifunctional [glutamate--ammonia ligase]-adenylyl-L-tyrosine phosphorylase/[glutamate--ammonia-ligase] adenylyltransferase n=1 Tax=Imbroritus primus TaxID=3058603 RepID=A0ACD3SJX2_9BURK|nr:bifunctional [glutamate--ammonia ligase]-adenylyl-L-tyrosine phosphorylase/[glutamate--ammonia-ligase] adenylyltransferase [Burkholderiaceae bacterium PBA]
MSEPLFSRLPARPVPSGDAGGALLAPRFSRYLHRIVSARPACAASLAEAAQSGQPLDAAWLEARLIPLRERAETAVGPGDAALGKALRWLRQDTMALIMERDLRGLMTLAEVTEAMTLLAECAVRTALAQLTADMAAQVGYPVGEQSGERQELIVVGMGKLGGRELNVSSDIDLIFLYDEEGETAGGKRSLSNHEYFIRLGRRLIQMLADVTEDGFVFRVDMRLRPNGDAGPLACSLAMLEEYFMVQGREWERYAWIKGRVVSAVESAHSRNAVGLLEQLTTPFVFRRYLDYGVISAIRSLHAQIRAEAGKREAGLAGHALNQRAFDIKLGRGGIREIEFTAQVFQLIRGGQDPSLRVRPTLQVLALAEARGLLAPEAVVELSTAYRFLRQLEHRLQYLDDAQTHHLPTSAADQQAIAAMMGMDSYDDLLAALQPHLDCVEQQFEATFAARQEGGQCGSIWQQCLQGEASAETCRAALQNLGYDDAEALVARLRATSEASRYRAMPDSSRLRFDQLVERALELSAKQDHPDRTMGRFLDFLEAISRRASYLSLLSEYPQAMARVADTLHASRWAADYLTRHPQLLDELLDTDALMALPDWAAFRQRLTSQLAMSDGQVETQMDILRREHHAETFRILLQDLQGVLTVEQIGDRLSDLADAMLDVVLETVWQQLPKRHRDTPRFAVVAYGRLGGKELGYASDLDIIFLYDDEDERAPDVYATFARRVITWMTSHTAAGILFDIDTRLRPNGAAGLLVTSFPSFRRYQLREGDNAAWVWEHQALTRARYCAGDREIGARFEEVRNEVLAQPRDAATLREEIVAMRAKVAEGHAHASDMFDLKHDTGGMVDIEFTVQYLVLLHSRTHPVLRRNAGNIALLHMSGALGLIDATLARRVADAYRQFRARQHQLRLDDGQSPARVPLEEFAEAAGHVRALWHAVFEG